MDTDGELMEDVEEDKARSPPPSLVPRLHVILSKPLKHGNPQLPQELTADQNKEGKTSEDLIKRACISF